VSIVEGTRARASSTSNAMSPLLERTIAAIAPPDEVVAHEVARLLEAKTKPPGSLGRLEDLASRLGAIHGRVPSAPLVSAIVVAAADHGVAAEGVSAYPREVTAQMLANFAQRGAAVCILAREVGARLLVVDAGVIDPPSLPGIRTAVVGGIRGTENLAIGPAMTRSTALGLVDEGVALANAIADDGVGVVAVGEMGIANTTAASAVCAALLPEDPSIVCGRGTGIDDARLVRKVDVVRRGLSANGLDRPPSDGAEPDPVYVLAAVGGLEIAFLVGVILGAATRRVPVLLDGFVTGTAALIAMRIAPASATSMIAATRSPEPAHPLVLRALGLEPLLDLGLRLGEGSGAALALPLVRAAVSILSDMATFEGAGVART
jgi:nicotinate-nucleotide--dimethylbenzimidazole phosphoribosyltransferase